MLYTNGGGRYGRNFPADTAVQWVGDRENWQSACAGNTATYYPCKLRKGEETQPSSEKKKNKNTSDKRGKPSCWNIDESWHSENRGTFFVFPFRPLSRFVSSASLEMQNQNPGRTGGSHTHTRSRDGFFIPYSGLGSWKASTWLHNTVPVLFKINDKIHEHASLY